MIIRQQRPQRVLPTTPSATSAPYPPFVVAALISTICLGALTGALNLFDLQVALRAVPIAHHRAHGLAQLFAFMLPLTIGVCFQLAPRFIGGPPPSRALVRQTAWTVLPGSLLLLVGRLGPLLPASQIFGAAGAILLTVGVSTWASFIIRLRLAGPPAPDALPSFLVAAAAWWTASALAIAAWQLGQLSAGPLSTLSLEPAYAMALFGGTASWLWGISLRAGLCTLRIDRPSTPRQLSALLAWQLGAGAVVAASFTENLSTRGAAWLALSAAMLLYLAIIKPFRSPPDLPSSEPLFRTAALAGLALMVVFAGLATAQGLSLLGLFLPSAFLADAVRHAFTLGAVLIVLGFVGRMLPGFDAVPLRWPRVFNTGIALLALGAVFRLAQLLAPSSVALAASGTSGFAAWLGITLASASLLGSLHWGAVRRRTHGISGGLASAAEVA